MIPRGKGYRILVVAVMTLWLSSLQEVCAGTLMPWSEAREVVREAYRMHGEGKAYEDSVSLAQAYTELKKWKYLFPTDFVRACYYYGRWLRAHENPVNAMQVLLEATHVRTKDYIILGRVYSNIANLCRMANCHDLAYEIFQRSNACFLQAGDTTLYYYGLNNLAVETAMQQDIRRTRMLLDSIKHGGIEEICFKTRETEAILYLYTQQHDSVLFATDYLRAHGYHHILLDLMRAQAFSSLEQNDSALYYANYVTSNTTNQAYLISTYYILSHNDKELSNESILTLTSKRADAQRAWTVIERNLAQAMQLLQEDLERKPNFGWLYAIIGTILIGTIGIGIYVYRRKKQHALLTQVIRDQQHRNAQLMTQNEHLQHEHDNRRTTAIAQIEEHCQLFRQSKDYLAQLHWNDLQQLCATINQHFFLLADKLSRLGVLNEQELRLCFLVLIGQFSDKQLADILNYSEKSIRTIKRNTAIKLGTTSKNMRTFLVEIAVK